MGMRSIFSVTVLAVLLAGCGQPAPPTTNFYHALHSGDLDQIKRHLYWGTEVNQAGPDGLYPLQVAVTQGRLAVARELLDHGARLDVRDPLGRTPLHLALLNGRRPAAELLLAQGAEDDLQQLLLVLVREHQLDRDTLELLVDRGVDLNALDSEGLAPLHRAVLEGRLKIAKWLLQQGADVNRVADSGATALALAQTEGADANLLQLLEQYGAEP
jgi:ankyrin repeat protein